MKAEEFFKNLMEIQKETSMLHWKNTRKELRYMIEKLDTAKVRVFDIVQESINIEIINKINEIIDYINSKEEII